VFLKYLKRKTVKEYSFKNLILNGKNDDCQAKNTGKKKVSFSRYFSFFLGNQWDGIMACMLLAG